MQIILWHISYMYMYVLVYVCSNLSDIYTNFAAVCECMIWCWSPAICSLSLSF